MLPYVVAGCVMGEQTWRSKRQSLSSERDAQGWGRPTNFASGGSRLPCTRNMMYTVGFAAASQWMATPSIPSPTSIFLEIPMCVLSWKSGRRI